MIVAVQYNHKKKLNTASVQLIPTTLIALRQEAGSAAPFEIVLPVLVVSLLVVGIALTCEKWGEHRW